MSGETGVVWFLRASEQELGPVRLVTVDGRISHSTAAELGQLLAHQNGHGLRGVVVDLSGVDYVNGAGLREFEKAAARLSGANTGLFLCGLRPAVQAAIDLAGAIPNLAVVESPEAALSRCERSPDGND